MDPMRKFLYGLSKNIVATDLEDMMFLLKLPEAVSEQTTSPLQLFKHLSKMYGNDDELVKCLEGIFTEMKREDLKEQVLKYVREQQQSNSGPLPFHHDSLVKSTSFPIQEPRPSDAVGAITRCQSFQGSPQQSQICTTSMERVRFISAPNSPPEERHTTPVQLMPSDERRSGELCSQLETATKKPLAARGQSAVRNQPADRSQSEERIQSLDRSQSEDGQSRISQNKQQNNVVCASGDHQMEQKILDHNLGRKTLAESLEIPSDTVHSPVPHKDQTRELEESSLPASLDQLLQNDENETKLKELYVRNSESSPSISSSLGNSRNPGGNSTTAECPNTTIVTAQSSCELADVDCDGSQLIAKVPASLMSPTPKKLTCSEIESEMNPFDTGAKANLEECMIGFEQSPKTQNSGIIQTTLSQTSLYSVGEPGQHFDTNQGKLGMASSSTADDLDLDEMHHVPQGFYGKFLRKCQLTNSLKKTQETIVMRKYQKELAKPGLEGKNCIICAPTGSGKTLTAGYICQLQRMKAAAERRPFKALFIVCIRNLILQQRDALSQIIVSEDGSKPVGGLGETTLLSEYMSTYDITVLTAQILVNCLKTGEVRMSDIDLLIMDECHHTILNHPYNTIMLEYHRLRKENPGRKLPQVIGLTASLGVGSAGDDPSGALYHYVKLCANLDASSITHVKEHLEELLLFNPKPQKDQIIPVEPRSTENIFYQILSYMMTEIERITLFPLATAAHTHGSQRYENWVVQQRIEAESKGLVDAILCTETLQRLNGALMLYDEMRACDAKRYLDAYFAEHFAEHFASQNRRPTFVLIKRLYNDMRQKMEEVIVKEKLSDNAKLHQLCTLLTDLYSTNTEARGIILTKTRLCVEILLNCIKELQELRHLVYPAKLVGQGGKEGRMTDVEQENTLRRFRHGRDGSYNLLIATDVAQEGLDMPKCNFVIRYNFVSNEIGTVQSKGRARAPNSECYLIVDRNSINEKKEYENLEKEHIMLQALEDIDEVDEKQLEDAIRREQEQILEEHEQKMQQKKAVTQLLDAENVTIHCRYCKSELCRATDIRLRLNNYICIAVDQLLTKVLIKKLDKPDEYRLDSKTGLCICNDRHCQKIIGSQLQYKQGIRKHGYVLSKRNIMWKYGNEIEYQQIKKWSAVPFEIKEEMLFPVL